ncbi:MAG TPA: methylamine utilization protein [Caulobacteraceae bacterium]
MRDAAGQPVANAVVTFRPAAGVHAPPPASGTFQVTQADIRFNPLVIVVPVGSEVEFPNHDKVRHHVYSFSPAKRFELRLYGKDESRHITFDQPGVVSLGCNIHDQMMGFVFVTDTPWAVKTGPDGEAVLKGVPQGAGTVIVWHPFLWGRFNEMTQSVTAPAHGEVRTAFSLKLHPPPLGKTPAL